MRLCILLLPLVVFAQDAIKIDFSEAGKHLIGEQGRIHVGEAVQGFEEIRLQVVVDEFGNVDTAKATDGPPELFSKAEALEYKRKFKPFEREGEAVRATFEDYVSVAPMEQWAEKKVAFPAIKDWNSLKMRLQRTGCFGSCPDYTVEVRGNGEVSFRGGSNVLITGQHRGSVSKQAVQKLAAVFQQANYFSLKDSYYCMVTDMPTFTTSIEFDGVKKTVTDYAGTQVGMPDVVIELEGAMDRLSGDEKWIEGNSETAAALVAEKWDFRSTSEENRSLFANVVAHGSPDLTELFVTHGAPALAVDGDGQGPLVSAAGKGDLGLVKTFLLNQTNVPAGIMTCTLGAAASSGNIELIDFLIDRGAKVNGPPCERNQKYTVLMRAVMSFNAAAVQEILKYEPDVNARDGRGRSALGLATQEAKGKEFVESLLGAGADVNSRDEDGQTPLFDACQNGNAEVTGLLIKAGADLNVRDANGQTVLMNCFNMDSSKLLVAAGADLTIQDGRGQTAAEQARSMNRVDKADLLDAALKAKKEKDSLRGSGVG